MYDELVKRLQDFAAGTMRDEDAQLAFDAADAIEFLLTFKVCFENMVRIGGWWLVGQDKALHRMNVPMNWPPEGTKTVEVFPLPPAPKEEI
jgi:hypothetical protein